ncbi:hypothetical protein [Iningainema tapete]|uniref:Uncharacterized protein n=1 Tax=Iningainema tapete BLCC-T55 TaxID=2748662 RepID=A0A8J7C646_9CYAN|nr:hypothetical protein [Iningainema tapete]MBD2773864.1 hypothetical protein [Iningainema tapete BLCC-T55]
MSTQEAAFVRELTQRYGSWIVMDFELEQHRHVLQILSRLNGDFLKDCGAYFGGGTFLIACERSHIHGTGGGVKRASTVKPHIL